MTQAASVKFSASTSLAETRPNAIQELTDGPHLLLTKNEKLEETIATETYVMIHKPLH